MKDKDTTCTFTTVVLADMTGDYEWLSKSIFHSSGVLQRLFYAMKRKFNWIYDSNDCCIFPGYHPMLLLERLLRSWLLLVELLSWAHLGVLSELTHYCLMNLIYLDKQKENDRFTRRMVFITRTSNCDNAKVQSHPDQVLNKFRVFSNTTIHIYSAPGPLFRQTPLGRNTKSRGLW